MSNAAFTHVRLTTSYRTKSLYKSIFVLSSSRHISFMKRIESLLKSAGIKFKFQNLETRFYKRQVSFLVVKTVKCKRSIKCIVLVTNFQKSPSAGGSSPQATFNLQYWWPEVTWFGHIMEF